MEEGITRRSFLRSSGLAVAALVLVGLPDSSRAGNYLHVRPEQQESDERLAWIKEVWKVPSTGHVGIEGWNESGLWSFYLDSKTGQVVSGLFSDYRGITFRKNDFNDEHKTLAQLRSEGVSWEEIDRLHYEGFSCNPGHQYVSV